jgi:hypothetical protein
MVCWCDTFRVFLCGLVLVLVLPSKSLFRVAANAASAAGFLLGRFFVEVLFIGARLVQVCKTWTVSEKLEMNFNFCEISSRSDRSDPQLPLGVYFEPECHPVPAGAHAHVFKLATLPLALSCMVDVRKSKSKLYDLRKTGPVPLSQHLEQWPT